MALKTIRVCFLWSDVSGYMAACWRELSRGSNIEVHVVAYGSSEETAFSSDLMEGLHWIPLDEASRFDDRVITSHIDKIKPNVLVVAGWLNPAYRRIVKSFCCSIPIVMTMDTPWWGKMRQHLGRFCLKPYLRNIGSVVVTGERSWQYARRLGFEGSRTYRGLYGIDFVSFNSASEARLNKEAWPRRFLFVGRYSKEKGLKLLMEAFRQYRAKVSDPWELVCCGKGPQIDLVRKIPGVVDCGFIQPSGVIDEMTHAGVFILPSFFDPWPLVIVEACASGLPVLASDACGSAAELIRDGYNGFTFSCGNVTHLTNKLIEAHERYDELPDMGSRAIEFAKPYSAKEWAKRWAGILKDQF